MTDWSIDALQAQVPCRDWDDIPEFQGRNFFYISEQSVPGFERVLAGYKQLLHLHDCHDLFRSLGYLNVSRPVDFDGILRDCLAALQGAATSPLVVGTDGWTIHSAERELRVSGTVRPRITVSQISFLLFVGTFQSAAVIHSLLDSIARAATLVRFLECFVGANETATQRAGLILQGLSNGVASFLQHHRSRVLQLQERPLTLLRLRAALPALVGPLRFVAELCGYVRVLGVVLLSVVPYFWNFCCIRRNVPCCCVSVSFHSSFSVPSSISFCRVMFAYLISCQPVEGERGRHRRYSRRHATRHRNALSSLLRSDHLRRIRRPAYSDAAEMRYGPLP